MECGSVAGRKGAVFACSGTSTRHSSTKEAARICTAGAAASGTPLSSGGDQFSGGGESAIALLHAGANPEGKSATSSITIADATSPHEAQTGTVNCTCTDRNCGISTVPGSAGSFQLSGLPSSISDACGLSTAANGAVVPDNSSAARSGLQAAATYPGVPQDPGQYYQPTGKAGTSHQYGDPEEEKFFWIRRSHKALRQPSCRPSWANTSSTSRKQGKSPSKLQQQPHLATDGPPPPPAGYNPLGEGYQSAGYLSAAQGIPYGIAFPYMGTQQPPVSTPKMSNQGVKPPKWDENKTALTKWFQDMVCFFKLTQPPRPQWGWIALNTLDETPKHSLLAQLGHMWGMPLNAETLSHPDFQMSWEQFKYAMETLYGHKCTDFEIRAQIAAFTKPGTSGPDTIKYMQLLEQMFLKCEKSIDDFSKLHALFTGLRPDLKRKCLLNHNNEQWSSYASLRAHLFKVGPTYDQEQKTHGFRNPSSHNPGLGVNKIIQKHHALRSDRRGVPILPDRNRQTGRFAKPGQRKLRVLDKQGAGRRPHGKGYEVLPELHEPMEGQVVSHPGQLKSTTLELLRRAQRCYKCFQPYTPGHSCSGGGTMPPLKVIRRNASETARKPSVRKHKMSHCL